jgi:hypothetical protein
MKDYGGLESVRLPVNRIWTPDIVLYNYADTRLEDKREALAIVNHDGIVKWKPPSILKSSCQIDIETFPYDVQRCYMKFGKFGAFVLEMAFARPIESLVTNRKLDVRWPLDRHSVLRKPNGNLEKRVCRVERVGYHRSAGNSQRKVLFMLQGAISRLVSFFFKFRWIEPVSPFTRSSRHSFLST